MISLLCLFVGLILGAVLGHKLVLRQNVGEALVANYLSNFNGLHVLFNNVTLPTENGTTLIDHILVTEAGVFIIETKHYAKWIFGNPATIIGCRPSTGRKVDFGRGPAVHVGRAAWLFMPPE